MTEHVEAGMAFYKQGKLDMVAPHLLHPVSKTHSLECVGLEKFDFNSAIFLKYLQRLSPCCAKQMTTHMK